MGRLVILSGPSGVGKDTVIDAWKRADPDVERVIAYTTRHPRKGEKNGVDYWFVSDQEFMRMVEAEEFLEYKKVVDHYYATPVRHTDRILLQGKIAILKIDVQGALDVMKKRPTAITVFLMPPDRGTLRTRLENRGTDSHEAIERRLAASEFELSQAGHYQHRIVNDNIQDVVSRLQELTAC